MKTINYKNALWIIITLILLVFTIRWKVTESVFNTKFVFESMGQSVTVVSFIGFIFCRYLWKFKIFRKWLVLIPDLNGEWEGVINSDYLQPITFKECKDKPTTLIIKQSLFKVSCVMKTDEMKSYSMNEGFIINEENQKYQLIYSYQSDPNLPPFISPMHYGTALYELENQYDVEEMKGKYWTDRKTTGTIFLKRK